MGEIYTPAQLNELFVQKVNTPDGLEKVAQETSAFIRNKLREVSFARKIINPQYVTKMDLQRSVQHDGLVKIVDIEPDSKAMVVNFRGDTPIEYIMGERYEIPFYKIESNNFQKTEEELLAYEMPITEVIERNSVLDIQKVEDGEFIKACDKAIDLEVNNGNITALTGTCETGTELGAIKKNDIKRLVDCLDGNELRCELILMDITTYNRFMLWNATTVGSPMGSETTVNGYTYSDLFGRKLVVTNKGSLLTPTGQPTQKNIYAFTAQEFFGQFLVLNDTKFWIEKKKNIITFSSWEIIGMGIGNTKSVARLTIS